MKQYKLSYGLSGMIGFINLYLIILMAITPIFVVIGYKTDTKFMIINLIIVFLLVIMLIILIFTIINLICKVFTKPKIYLSENEIIYKHYKIEFNNIKKINFVFPNIGRSISSPYGVSIVHKVIYQKGYQYDFFDRIPLSVLFILLKKCGRNVIKFPTVKRWYIILFNCIIVAGLISDIIILFVIK